MVLAILHIHIGGQTTAIVERQSLSIGSLPIAWTRHAFEDEWLLACRVPLILHLHYDILLPKFLAQFVKAFHRAFYSILRTIFFVCGFSNGDQRVSVLLQMRSILLLSRAVLVRMLTGKVLSLVNRLKQWRLGKAGRTETLLGLRYLIPLLLRDLVHSLVLLRAGNELVGMAFHPHIFFVWR